MGMLWSFTTPMPLMWSVVWVSVMFRIVCAAFRTQAPSVVENGLCTCLSRALLGSIWFSRMLLLIVATSSSCKGCRARKQGSHTRLGSRSQNSLGSSALFSLQLWQKMRPQARQWCLRTAQSNITWHWVQCVTSSSGTHRGSAPTPEGSPRNAWSREAAVSPAVAAPRPPRHPESPPPVPALGLGVPQALHAPTPAWFSSVQAAQAHFPLLAFGGMLGGLAPE
mmetsp:Transcript_14276/g.19685  ORF Transcript_14276/g.19685 Transcript_14276/m.19685 type:complete len:223 (+) Transcript_14276:689-1357(+)